MRIYHCVLCLLAFPSNQGEATKTVEELTQLIPPSSRRAWLRDAAVHDGAQGIRLQGVAIP
jgi:hypothetical protein